MHGIGSERARTLGVNRLWQFLWTCHCAKLFTATCFTKILLQFKCQSLLIDMSTVFPTNGAFSAHTVNYILYGTELVAPNLSDAEKTLFVFITPISIKLFHRTFVADRWCPHYPGNLVVVFIAFISNKKHVWPRKIAILDLHILVQFCTCLLDPEWAWRTEFWLKSILQPLFVWGMV